MNETFQKRRYFITGLIVILPIWVTFFVLFVIFKWISGMTNPILMPLSRIVFEKGSFNLLVSIVSFFLTLFVIYMIGLLYAKVLGRNILSRIGKIIRGIPFLNGIYIAAKKLTEYVTNVGTEYKQIVLVEYPRRGAYVIGFVTSESSVIYDKENRMFNVFIPRVPNPAIGYLVIAREKDLTPLNINFEEALNLIVSGGIIQPSQEKQFQQFEYPSL
jgi:uncharacterized membrane protein